VSHPPVLLIDPNPVRRRELARDLAAATYEVVPAIDTEEGLRFARSLTTAVVVAPAHLAREGQESLLTELAASSEQERRVVVLIGGAGEEPEDLPDGVFFLPADGLDTGHLFERIHLVLIGCEMGIATDWRLNSLVGDLGQHPLLELLKACGHFGFSGHLETDGGSIFLDRGQAIAARAGQAVGMKAVCRLARIPEGPFRLLPAIAAGGQTVPREIYEDLGQALVTIIENTLTEIPDRGSRLQLVSGSDFFTHPLTDVEREVLSGARQGIDLGALLDASGATDGEIVRAVVELEERGLVVREEPLPPVRILTDSTADLPVALAREHGIAVVPLQVHFGQRVFQDRVNLTPGVFYRLLAELPDHPRSSPPSPEAFAEAYKSYLERQNIVSLHISAKLSETAKNAGSAVERVLASPPRRGHQTVSGGGSAPWVEVIDTGQVSLPLGLLSLFAARMAARGLGVGEIATVVREISGRIHSYFIVDTLDYLARGGRIGKARALVGNLFRIKPILTLEKGEVAPFDQVRGGRAAHPRILEHLTRKVEGKGPIFAGIAHAAAPIWADRLRKLVEERFEVVELLQVEMGPVVGTHVGPGTVGVCIFQPTAEELAQIAPPRATPGSEH